MKAIILAAGRGSRMKGLTEEKPKCLNELLNRSLLDWQLSALRAAGVSDIVVGRGYKKQMLQGDFQTFDNDQWSSTNMVKTLDCGRDHLREDTCLVSYADIVYHPDHIKALVEASGDVVISYDQLWRPLWELRFSDPLADAETFVVDSAGIVLEIGQRATSLEQIQGQYMGLLKFTPRGWKQVEAVLNDMDQATLDGLDMTSLLQRLIKSGVKIHTAKIKGKWCEADSENDLNIYSKKIESEWTHDWRWE